MAEYEIICIQNIVTVYPCLSYTLEVRNFEQMAGLTGKVCKLGIYLTIVIEVFGHLRVMVLVYALFACINPMN